MYEAFKRYLIDIQRYPEGQADCVVTLLRAQGTTNDVTDIRNIFRPKDILGKLEEKANFAMLMCKNGPFIIGLIVLGLIAFCCCCIACCCCRSKQNVMNVPPTIQLSVPPLYPNGVKIPYERVQNV